MPKFSGLLKNLEKNLLKINTEYSFILKWYIALCVFTDMFYTES